MKTRKIYQIPQILVFSSQLEGPILGNSINGTAFTNASTNTTTYNKDIGVSNEGVSTVTNSDLDEGVYSKSFGGWDDLGVTEVGGTWE